MNRKRVNQHSARSSEHPKKAPASDPELDRSPDELEGLPDEAIDPEDSARIRRHPAALEEADEPISTARPRPVDDEGRPRRPAPTSGTLASLGDSDALPIVDAGFPIEPEALGRQFLRNATDQDNFESQAPSEEAEPGAYPIGQLVSEATLEAAGQEGLEVPESSALAGSIGDADLEPALSEVDLTSDVVHEASLFDHLAEPIEEERMLPPDVSADELGEIEEHRPRTREIDEEARAAEMSRERKVLRRLRDRTAVRAGR